MGKARFEQFTEQLGRHLMRGRSLVRDVVEELHPDSVRMEDAAAAADAQECVMSAVSQSMSAVARPAHPDAAHGNGAADRHRARRPRRGGNCSTLTAPFGSPVVGPRAYGRGAARKPMASESSAWSRPVGAEVHRGQPLLSAELPETGERFEGILPPAAPGPAFARASAPSA